MTRPASRLEETLTRKELRIVKHLETGASNREMAIAMGVNIKRLFTIVFGFGAALCAIAGAMLGPILQCRSAWARAS